MLQDFVTLQPPSGRVTLLDSRADRSEVPSTDRRRGFPVFY